MCIKFKYFSGDDLYNYLFDYRANNPTYKIKQLIDDIEFFDGICSPTFNSDTSFHYFTAIYNGDIIGMLKLKVGGSDSSRYRGYCNWISFISIKKEYRGKGYSKQLLNDCFTFAKEKNINILMSGYTQLGWSRIKNNARLFARQIGIELIDDRTCVEY